MAPLDTGYVMNLHLVDPLGDRVGPAPTDYEQIGAYLRSVREHRHLSFDQLAETTRINKTYLQAIEDGNVSVLPSRPFAIGYVRSYALALGIDGDAAAARFKAETPDLSEPLRNPIGVKHEKTRRNPLLLAMVGLLVTSVVVWNVAQRSIKVVQDPMAPIASLTSAQAAEPKEPPGTIALGTATPPPADQTTPVAYVTPGMDLTTAQGGGATKVVTNQTVTAAAVPSGYAPSSVFVAKGAVFGAADTTPAVVLQAKKAASLIVRGASGSVYFARQLAPGEAYRAPTGEGLTADIADPDSFELYVNGQLQSGPLSGQAPVDKLAAPKPAAKAA